MEGMGTLRKLLVYLFIAVFGASLLLLAVAVSLNHVFGTPEYIKRSLGQSGLYERVVNDVLDQNQAAADQTKEGTLPLDREEVRQAANQAFNPQLLRRSTEPAIDGTYAWLEGQTDKPDFRVDLSAAKTDFANRIGSYIRERLADLPPCTLDNMPTTTDPFTINCRPPAINFETEIRRLTNQLATSPDYLADPVITPEDVTVRQDGKEVPFYQAADNLPDAFQWMRRAPFVLGLLTVLAAAAVIALSPLRRQGIKRVTVSLVVSGAVLLIGFGLFKLAVSSLSSRVGEANVHATNYLQTSVMSATLATLEEALRGLIIGFGVMYILLGLLLFVILRMVLRRRFLASSPKGTEK